MVTHLRSARCVKKEKIPVSKTTSNLLSHLVDNHKTELESVRTERRTKVDSRHQSQAAQPSIRSSFTPKMSVETRKAANVDLAMLLADKSLSLSLPSSRMFRTFVQRLNPSYTPPSPSSILKIMENQVAQIDEDNKGLISISGARVAITADCWSAFNANTGLLAITGHILNSLMETRSSVIFDCVPLGLESLVRLDIDEARVSAMVADGAANMKRAAANLNIKYLHCGAHLINLAVRKSLSTEHVAPLLQKCKIITGKLSRSCVMKGLFKSYLDELHLPKITPVTDCPIRWGSTYMMICDILSTRGAVDKLMESQYLEPCEDDEIRSLKSIKNFLEPYYELTKKVCATDATCSVVLAGGKLLLAKKESLCNESRTRMKQFGNMLLMETRKQFAPSFADETLRISTVLDPRFAFVERIASAEEWKATVERLIEMNACNCSVNEESQSDSQTPSSKEVRASFWEPLSESEKEPESKRCLLSTQGEEMMYSLLLKKQRPDKDSCPFQWWRSHSEEFPLLYKEVPRYLCIPATSVDCERLFCLAGIVFSNKRRGRLSGKHARLLLMCKAHANKDVGRECKSWSTSDVKRYPKSDDVDEIEEDFTSSSDEDLEDSSLYTISSDYDLNDSRECVE